MKPILIGLDNPHSTDPANALAPYPKGCAGQRLWTMLATLPTSLLVDGGDRARRSALYHNDYMDTFDRCNVFQGVRKPHREQWRGYALELLDQLPKGAHAVVLGDEVRQVLNTALTTPLKLMLIHPQVIDGVTWRVLPHPSGRVWFYNDPVMRTLAGMVLLDVLAETQRSACSGKK